MSKGRLSRESLLALRINKPRSETCCGSGRDVSVSSAALTANQSDTSILCYSFPSAYKPINKLRLFCLLSDSQLHPVVCLCSLPSLQNSTNTLIAVPTSLLAHFYLALQNYLSKAQVWLCPLPLKISHLLLFKYTIYMAPYNLIICFLCPCPSLLSLYTDFLCFPEHILPYTVPHNMSAV